MLIAGGLLFILFRRRRAQSREWADYNMYVVYEIACQAIIALAREKDLPHDKVVKALNAARETYNEALLSPKSPRLPMMKDFNIDEFNDE